MIGHVIFAIEDDTESVCYNVNTFEMSSALHCGHFSGTLPEKLIQIGAYFIREGETPNNTLTREELDEICKAKQCIGPEQPDYHPLAADAVHRVSRAAVEALAVNHKCVLKDIATGEYELAGNDDTLSPVCTPSIEHAEVYDTVATRLTTPRDSKLST